MFTKILIANRGEIACRVITTARRMGIRTVAVFSDADRGARHVEMADEAVHIGPAPVAESYLKGAAVIAAALRTGAQAIHPGYGFLSENPEFVEAVAAAGLVFIGPPAPAIRAMGLKDAAKALMVEAGVPVVPGYHGARQEPEFLAAEAGRIGYPVLIKARAGGGGRGMRLVERPEAFAEALISAQREAQSAFGDPACLIERYVPRPRHIEIQVFGDSQGNVVHLFERDCSLQRRHQKVIEEAPAPGMTEAMRRAMGKAAVAAARAVGYQGAGTVEFIADGSGPLREDGFWFMEMNTRLQVEHPVSEAITGLDFVELQLRVAASEALPFAQSDLKIDGWAFEARLYAEDVARGFLPATGRLQHLRFPEAAQFARGPVRIDSGVAEGDSISPWYDPMIAKVVAHGPTRAAALARLERALAQCRIAGTTTNLAFLGALARHPGFAAGAVDTGLIARDLDDLALAPPVPPVALALAALALAGATAPPPGIDPWEALAGHRHWGPASDWVSLGAGADRRDLRVDRLGGGRFRVLGGDLDLTLGLTVTATGLQVEHDGRVWRAEATRLPDALVVMLDGACQVIACPDVLAAPGSEAGGGDTIIAPMPGLVSSVRAAAGARVARGETLVVLEAMKMEHALLAPRDGLVAEALVAEGDQVADGTVLLRLEAEDG